MTRSYLPYPPRIQAIRHEIIVEIPRVPNNRTSLAQMRRMSTSQLIVALLTWRTRSIPAKPRQVTIWSEGVAPWELDAVREDLQPFLSKIEAGEDLTPQLSELVKTKGIVLPGASSASKGQDVDKVLTREGLHHFHFGKVGPANPKGRSGRLVFAEVLQDEFRIVAISNHGAFQRGSPEHIRFFRICLAYAAKDVPSGQGFMTNPVMSSGHSMLLTVFATKCENEIERLDPFLDDHNFVDQIYASHPVTDSGTPVTRPVNPSFAWHFEDLQFGFIEKQTGVFFCIFPFFAR